MNKYCILVNLAALVSCNSKVQQSNTETSAEADTMMNTDMASLNLMGD